MIHKETGVEKTVMKIRGITLDQKTCQQLHFDVFKEDIVKNYGQKSFVLDYHRISVDKLSRVVTSKQTKTYQAVFEKGVIMDDYRVVPFGYKHNKLY